MRITEEAIRDPIAGVHKIVLMGFDWDPFTGDDLIGVHYYTDNKTCWSIPHPFPWLSEGSTVKIVPIQNKEPEYMSGKRYWLIGTTNKGESMKVAFQPGSERSPGPNNKHTYFYSEQFRY